MRKNENKSNSAQLRDLSRLSRKQLLELLLRQTRRVEELEQKLSETEKKLEDRRITEREAGSIAEAALRLNGVFEAAQAAADQYLENIRAAAEEKAPSVVKECKDVSEK